MSYNKMEGESRDLEIEIQHLETKWTEMLRNVEPPEKYNFRSQCIYRVPPILRENNPKAYTPQHVSIGPYHHNVHEFGEEDNNLESTEKLKLKYLKGFLNRTQLHMRDFVVKLKELEGKIRLCYAEPIKYNGDDFLKIILVDACFIIEHFLRWHEYKDWMREDPLLRQDWMRQYISNDLLLLENQLPFFVLEELYNLTGTNEKFLDITFDYFESELLRNVCPGESPKHFTDFLRSSIISSSKLDRGKPEECEYVQHVYSTSQLMEAGLEFEVSQNKGLLDLTYFKHGVLRMPILNIDDSTEILFRNMMAYEHCHCHPSEESIITQYVTILDFLINTEKDVNVLVDKKIIVNLTGDANKVVKMVNNLCSQLSIPSFDSRYVSLCKSLNDFYENPWNKFKATLKHDYFDTPWKIASTIAAVVLLLLTFIQTVCSMISLFYGN